MPTPQELEIQFWAALKTEMTMMVGVDGQEDGHARPMTAQIEGEKGPIWFFTSTESTLAKLAIGDNRAIATFVSKGHDLFATVHGKLAVNNDRAVVDRLWNHHIAAWYQGGKQDPNLLLLRLDAEQAEIWLDGSSLFAGLKMLMGSDPKQDYKDNVAKVDLRN
jgi:general stress protein 26